MRSGGALVWIGALNNKRIYRNARYHHDTNTRISPTYDTELFDVRTNYVVNLKTSCPKKMPYAGEFAT